jgi:hypothetical protein
LIGDEMIVRERGPTESYVSVGCSPWGPLVVCGHVLTGYEVHKYDEGQGRKLCFSIESIDL